jgi:hypothetical protein
MELKTDMDGRSPRMVATLVTKLLGWGNTNLEGRFLDEQSGDCFKVVQGEIRLLGKIP